MAPEGQQPGPVPGLPVRGPGFWVPALILPLLLLGAGAASLLLGSGPVAVILGCSLILGAVSSLAYYGSAMRRRRRNQTRTTNG